MAISALLESRRGPKKLPLLFIPYAHGERPPPGSVSNLVSIRFDFLFMLETLGSPKSSPSSLSYAYSSSPSSSFASQSSLVYDKKSV